MIKTIGVDCGRSACKAFDGENKIKVPSYLSKARQRVIGSIFTERDFVVGYDRANYYVGELAIREGEHQVNDMRSDKVHLQTKIMTLMSLALLAPDESVHLISGHPLTAHKQADIERMKALIPEGRHDLVVNGVPRTVDIAEHHVAAEGACAAYGIEPFPARAHIVDVGSRTVNFVTLANRGIVDRLSGTLNFGAETIKSTRDLDVESLAYSVASHLQRIWTERIGVVFLIGGLAEPLLPYFSEHFAPCEVAPSPVFANAIGMQRIGKAVASK